MCTFAVVEEIRAESKTALLKPFPSDSCMGCPKKCGKYGKPYVAKNPLGSKLAEKSVVRVRISRIQYFLQGFFSLIFPIATAFAALFLFGPLSRALFIPALGPSFCAAHEETLRFLSVLALFLLSASFVFFLSRGDFRIAKPEIAETIIDASEADNA